MQPASNIVSRLFVFSELIGTDREENLSSFRQKLELCGIRFALGIGTSEEGSTDKTISRARAR